VCSGGEGEPNKQSQHSISSIITSRLTKTLGKNVRAYLHRYILQRIRGVNRERDENNV
jgi:hypothetical protein